MLDKQEEQKLIAFILHHKELMSCQDIADEAGVPYGKIIYIARKAGIALLSVAERNKKFIGEKIGSMKRDKIRKALDLGEAQFIALYREMGLTHEDFAMENKVGRSLKSPREVFQEGFPSSISAQAQSIRAFRLLENSGL